MWQILTCHFAVWQPGSEILQERNVNVLTSQTLSLAHEAARCLYLHYCSGVRRLLAEEAVGSGQFTQLAGEDAERGPFVQIHYITVTMTILVLHDRYVPVKRILKLFVLSERAMLLRRHDGVSRRTVSAFPFYTLRLQYIRTGQRMAPEIKRPRRSISGSLKTFYLHYISNYKHQMRSVSNYAPKSHN